jgi:hypothetical protein
MDAARDLTALALAAALTHFRPLEPFSLVSLPAEAIARRRVIPPARF